MDHTCGGMLGGGNQRTGDMFRWILRFPWWILVQPSFAQQAQLQTCPVSLVDQSPSSVCFPRVRRAPCGQCKVGKKRKDGQGEKYDRSRTGRLGRPSLARDQLGWVQDLYHGAQTAGNVRHRTMEVGTIDAAENDLSHSNVGPIDRSLPAGLHKGR